MLSDKVSLSPLNYSKNLFTNKPDVYLCVLGDRLPISKSSLFLREVRLNHYRAISNSLFGTQNEIFYGESFHFLSGIYCRECIVYTLHLITVKYAANLCILTPSHACKWAYNKMDQSQEIYTCILAINILLGRSIFRFTSRNTLKGLISCWYLLLFF